MISVGFAADVVTWKTSSFFFPHQKLCLYIEMAKREKVQSITNSFQILGYKLGVTKGFRVKTNFFSINS